MSKHPYLLALLLLALLEQATSQALTVSNVEPRRDEAGQILDAHDGNLMQFEGRFYLYGAVYGNTDGFTKANAFQAYSSPDLKNWKTEGRLLTDVPEGTYYRPKVVFNPKTRKYVLWYNWYPQLWDGQYGVAVADKPTGPFTIVNTDVKLSRPKVGDFNLLVDDDGTAYISYNTINGHRIFIERLNADYTGSTGHSSQEITNGCEASALFKRGQYYYLLTDQTCCFCGEGTGARVYMSTHPLSGYQYRGNINRHRGEIRYAANDGSKNAQGTVVINQKQYAEIQLAREFTVESLTLTVAENRFCSHCVVGTNGKIISNETYPTIRLAYRNEAGEWVNVSSKVTAKNRTYQSTNTYRLGFSPFKTNRIQLSTDAIPFEQFLPISEIEVFANGKNVGNAAADALVIEVKDEGTIPELVRTPVIIPAQQTYVAQISTAKGPVFIWMGDLWGSRPDGVKGHDFQYWSSPLQFDKTGMIQPLFWTDSWTVSP